jgi:hypothetical protein
MTFEQAMDWYQNLATNMDRAGVKIRFIKCYPNIADTETAFVMAVVDEQARKRLP